MVLKLATNNVRGLIYVWLLSSLFVVVEQLWHTAL
jgi:hypothetical protein